MAIVPSPPAAPPPHSLVRAADTTHDSDPDWEKGLQYLPEAPGGYRAAAYCSVEEVDRTRTQESYVDYEPWEARFYDPCETTFGYHQQEVEDRLARIAAATESYAIARELWTGELAQAAGLPNAYLGKAPVVVSAAAVTPRHGIGLLEEAIGDKLMGQQAFLHVPRLVQPQLWDLEKVGNLLYTRIDNALVCDAGYPGSPPDGTAAADGTTWMYATGPVVVRRAPLVMYATRDAEVIDTETNQRYRTASKMVAATFDHAALFAVPVTLD